MAGQDWLEKDFYALLGVSKTADAAEVKKAYRKKARTLHPDANPGDAAAERRFKDVGEAYAILSDPEQRRQYDSVRAMGSGARFTAGGPGAPAGSAGFEDLLGGLFNGGSPRARYEGAPRSRAGGPGGRGGMPQGGVPPGMEDLLSGLFADGGGAGPQGRRPAGYGQGPSRPVDLQASTQVSFAQAVLGATLELTVEGRTVRANVPAGIRDGAKVRIRGRGRPGPGGGPTGDLMLTVSVVPHPVFTRDGDDLKVTVPVTFAEAALGADVQVPTLDGAPVTVRVPAGTPSGRTLRVRGRGVSRAGSTGDLLVTTTVAVPQRLDDDARAAVQAFAAATASAPNPRDQLLERAAAAAVRAPSGS